MCSFPSAVVLLGISAISLVSIPVRGTTYDQMILEEIELNEKVTIQSVNYPQCCTEVVHTVRCNSEHGPCYIRLEFSDLDLPRGSTLHIFDGEIDSSRMFAEQPEMKKGVWFRPAIASSGTVISLHFKPKAQRLPGCTGFKAVAWSTNSPPDQWHDKPTSDGCGIVRNVLDGSKVTLIFPRRPSDIYQASYETVQDCLYLLTVPNPRVEYANVFVRFTAVNFEGSIQVVKGRTSDGVLLGGDDMSTTQWKLNKPTVDSSEEDSATDEMYSDFSSEEQLRKKREDDTPGLIEKEYSSRKGLYIRAVVFNSKYAPAELEFVYGTYVTVDEDDVPETGHDCKYGDFDGYLCDNREWCIPPSMRCNRVYNCEDEADEMNCPLITTTTTTTTVYTTAHTTKRPAPVEPQKTSTTTTATMTNRCAHEYLNTVPCKNSDTVCIQPSYVCDNYDDCGDNSDEEDCFKGCASDEEDCGDNICVPYDSEATKCASVQCTGSGYYQCDDGRGCRFSSDVCDGYPDCSDASDEEGCASSKSWLARHWYTAIGLLCGIVVFCIACCRALAKKTRAQSASSNNAPPPQYGDVNMQRMAPQPTATAGYTPVPTSSPPGEPRYNIPPSAPAAAPATDPNAAPPPSYDEAVTNQPYKDAPPSYNNV